MSMRITLELWVHGDVIDFSGDRLFFLGRDEACEAEEENPLLPALNPNHKHSHEGYLK